MGWSSACLHQMLCFSDWLYVCLIAVIREFRLRPLACTNILRDDLNTLSLGKRFSVIWLSLGHLSTVMSYYLIKSLYFFTGMQPICARVGLCLHSCLRVCVCLSLKFVFISVCAHIFVFISAYECVFVCAHTMMTITAASLQGEIQIF